MDNPERLAALGTPDEYKQNTISVGHHHTEEIITDFTTRN